MVRKIRQFIWFVVLLVPAQKAIGQVPDTVYLPAVIYLDSFTVQDVGTGFSVSDFIDYVKADTTFYEAFRNLRRINYHSSATARFFDDDHLATASYSNRTFQHVENNCRWMDFLFEASTGDFFDDDGEMNYYTSRMFSYIFLYHDTICNKIVETDNNLGTDDKLEKHKEQLKVLIFNPGQPVEGIPIIKNKMAIFDPEMIKYYDYSITQKRFDTGVDCYVFTVKKKQEVKEDDVVIKELVTWFDKKTLDIVSRQYSLGYHASIFDFDVTMNVRLTSIDGYRVPEYIYYNGFWDVPTKKPETGSVQISVWK